MNRYYPLPSLLLSAIIFVLGLTACYKLEGELILDPPDPVMPPNEELREQVQIIDSTQFNLVSDSTEIDNGIYRFSISGDVPQLQPGDVIVGEQGLGFLRKVQAITEETGEIIVETIQATMEDVFLTTNFTIDLDLAGSRQYKNLDLQHELLDLSLYEAKGGSLMANGAIGFETDLHLSCSFKDGVLDSLSFETRNAQMQAALTLNAETNEAISLPDKQTTVSGYQKLVRVYLPVGGVQLPVVIELTTDFILNCSADLEADISTSLTFTNDNRLDLGLRYTDAAWTGNHQLTPNYDLEWGPPNGATMANIQLELKPVLTARIYGVRGPHLSVAMKGELVGELATPNPDWNVTASTWMQSAIGIESRIFGQTLFDYDQNWEADRLSYRTPFAIEKISGDQQSVLPGFTLADPVRVRILDELGRPQRNVPVYFEVQSGGGNVSSLRVLSDEEGYAATYWTLGPEPETTNRLRVRAFKADGNSIGASPITFTAASTFVEDASFVGTWLLIAHSNIDCTLSEDEFIDVANNDGIICNQDCTSAIVCNDACARTVFEFSDEEVRVYSHSYDLDLQYIETDTTDYSYMFTGSRTLRLMEKLNPTKQYDVEFTLNNNELDLFSTELDFPDDCKEEILLRRQ